MRIVSLTTDHVRGITSAKITFGRIKRFKHRQFGYMASVSRALVKRYPGLYSVHVLSYSGARTSLKIRRVFRSIEEFATHFDGIEKFTTDLVVEARKKFSEKREKQNRLKQKNAEEKIIKSQIRKEVEKEFAPKITAEVRRRARAASSANKSAVAKKAKK